MQLVRRLGGQARRVMSVVAIVATAVVAGACSSDNTGAGPVLPGTPQPNPQITRAAFLADVNVRTGEVKIRAPQLTGTQNGLGALRGEDIDASLRGVDLSLVGGDVVNITTSNFVASAIGAFTPGKVRVTFDVNLTNKLSGVQLVGPTVFPAPPAGTTGPILFPYDIAVAVTAGGTATGGQGNDVIVTLPSYGLVAPSTDWNGAPHSFFNDVSCSSPNNGGGGSGGQGSGGGFGQSNGSDCFRWEEFAGPIFPGSTTSASNVGFDLDPTVGQFTARLIVAADLQNSGPAPTGTIAGTVTSPQLGALNGVTVTATSGITSLPGTTAGAGAYSIAGVPTGPASVAITGGLPAGCTNPGSQAATVTNGGTATINFTVTCPVPNGSIAGQITFTGFTPAGAAIDGITVTATPTGGSAVSGNVTSTGALSVSGVPINISANGAVALANLPAGCTAVPAGSYTGLTNGGSQTVNFTVPCVAPPAFYQYTGTAVDNGATVTISYSIDMTTRDDAAIPGADDVSAIQGSFTYNSARLSAPICGNVSGSGLTNGTFNTSTAGTIGFLNFSTTGIKTGVQGVLTCTFTDAGSGALTTLTTLTVAASDNGTDLLPNTQRNDIP